jgi:hypothetical protein
MNTNVSPLQTSLFFLDEEQLGTKRIESFSE